MDINQAVQIITSVCAAHLCNRQDRVAIEMALNILRGVCQPVPKSAKDEKGHRSPVAGIPPAVEDVPDDIVTGDEDEICPKES